MNVLVTSTWIFASSTCCLTSVNWLDRCEISQPSQSFITGEYVHECINCVRPVIELAEKKKLHVFIDGWVSWGAGSLCVGDHV